MESITPSKYRDNETLVNDAMILINQDGLSYGTKWAALNNILWHWTERDGKYHGHKSKSGCRLWSDGALRALGAFDTPSEELPPKKIGSKLTHEHVVPRAYLTKFILSNTWIREDLKRLLETCCRAVISLKDGEDNKLDSDSMPEYWNWPEGNPWARYAEAEIKVFEVDKIQRVKRKWEISLKSPKPISLA